jgi:hypothetical protein
LTKRDSSLVSASDRSELYLLAKKYDSLADFHS